MGVPASTVTQKIVRVRIARYVSLAMLLFTCTEEVVIPGDVPELPHLAIENSPPTDFTVTAKNISSHSAVLDWAPVYDRDGDTLYNSIYLNGSLIAQQKNSFAFKLAQLKPETQYTGKVVVTDSKSTAKESFVQFTTKKYSLRFNRLFDNYEGKFAEGFAINTTQDGGYVIAASVGFNQQGYGLLVVKVDSLGYEQWHSAIEAHETTALNGKIEQTKDMGFIVTNQAAVTKLNSVGTFQWQQRPSSTVYQEYNSVIETDDQGFLVVGMRGGTPARGSVTKFNSSGVLLWEKIFDDQVAVPLSYCSQIVKVSEHEYLIAGSHQNANFDFELATIKIDELGNVLWAKIYPHTWAVSYHSVKIAPVNSDFIVAATSLASNGDARMRTVKINREGGVIWDTSYDWEGYEKRFKAITSFADGSSILAGSSSDYNHNRTAVILKINSQGNILWRKDYRPAAFMDYVWEFRGVTQAPDKGLVLMGIKAWIWTGTGKEKGLWLMKTDENGE